MHIEQFVNSGCLRVRFGLRAIVASMIFFALPTLAGTLDRIKETGHIKLGYIAEARPFTYDNAGKPEGYTVALCQQIADQVKGQLDLANLSVDWVPVTIENHISQVQQGDIDLLCTPATATLTRRKDVAFSIPVFPSGIRAVIRKDADPALRAILADTPAQRRPQWRGAPAARLLDKKTFAVVSQTTTDAWLAVKIHSFQIDAQTVRVADYREGLQKVLDRKADVFFGERSVMLGAMDNAARENLEVLDRLLTQEPVSLALARGDEDFRLLVDRTLSKSYASAEFGALFTKWFGEFNDKTRTFFLWTTVTP